MKGWTLEHAAERMCVDIKHLQKIEAGTVNVTLVTLTRVALGLGVGVAQLFDEVPAMDATAPNPASAAPASSRDRMKLLGRRVGQLHRLRALTQAQLADRVSIKPSVLIRLENGRSASCPIGAVIAIAEVLGVRADVLFHDGELDLPSR